MPVLRREGDIPRRHEHQTVCPVHVMRVPDGVDGLQHTAEGGGEVEQEVRGAMSFTNLTLQRWDGEWPEFIEVSHEGTGDLMRYVPERKCHNVHRLRNIGFKCSVCGYDACGCRDCGVEPASWDHCPECGSVVEHDESVCRFVWNGELDRWETSCGRCSYEPRGHYEWCPQCGREVVYVD